MHVDHDGEQRPGQRDARSTPMATPRGSGSGQAGIALAGHGRVGPSCRARRCCSQKAAEREAEQHDGAAPPRAPGRVAAPTTAKKILVDSTSKLPPSTSGLPKSARLSTKPSRKALARPGPHQRQVTVRKVVQRLGAQRLRRLLQRRADALHDADQHQEGDRREGQQLREEHARQAVDPARARDVEPVGQQAARRTPERPNSRISARPMTKGGVMIGRTESTRSAPLAAEARARRDQREGEAERGAAEADEDAEEQRVPGHAAAQLAVEAVEAPDRPVGELLRRTRAGAKAPSLSWTALTSIFETGKKTNSAISAMTVPIERTTKTSPRHQPRAGEAAAEDEQERRQQRRRRRGPCRPASGRARRTAPPSHAAAPALAGRWRSPAPSVRTSPSTPATTSSRAPRAGASARTAATRRRDSPRGNDDRQQPPRAGEREHGGRAGGAGGPRAEARPARRKRPARYHGSSAKPASASREHGQRVGPALPLRPHRRPRRPAAASGAPYFGSVFTSCVPLGEQAAALGRRAVLGEVVVDELDVGELGRLRRDRRRLVRRHLVGLRVGAERLRLGRQRPVVPLLGAVEVARALDDRHRADLVAGALARRDGLHRRAVDDHASRGRAGRRCRRSSRRGCVALAGAAPDFVYWFTFLCSAFM